LPVLLFCLASSFWTPQWISQNSLFWLSNLHWTLPRPSMVFRRPRVYYNVHIAQFFSKSSPFLWSSSLLSVIFLCMAFLCMGNFCELNFENAPFLLSQMFFYV
jgi:hypothetical protein